jgi:hypothetical protein
VERERRNKSFVWVDPLSKWMNHSQEIKGLVMGDCKRVGAHMKLDLDLKRMAKVTFHEMCPCLI